jgi:hypothetical protein
VLQTSAVPRIVATFERWIDEQVGAALTTAGHERDLVVRGEKRLEAEQGHDPVVVRPCLGKIRHIDSEMTDHARSLALLWTALRPPVRITAESSK